MSPQSMHSIRSKRVTVISWTDDDGTVNLEAWAAAGGSNSRATHQTAADRVEELLADGIERHMIVVRTVVIS